MNDIFPPGAAKRLFNPRKAILIGAVAAVAFPIGFALKWLYVATLTCPIGADGIGFLMFATVALFIAALLILPIMLAYIVRTNSNLSEKLKNIPLPQISVLAVPISVLFGSFLYWGFCRPVQFPPISTVDKIEFSNLTTGTYTTLTNRSDIENVTTFFNRKSLRWVYPTPEFGTPARLVLFNKKHEVAEIFFGTGGVVRDGALLMNTDPDKDALALCSAFKLTVYGGPGRGCTYYSR